MQNSLAKDKNGAAAGKVYQNSGGKGTQSKGRAKTATGAGASGQRAPKNPIKKLIGTAKKKLKSSTKAIPTSLAAATTKSYPPPSGHKKKFLSAGT